MKKALIILCLFLLHSVYAEDLYECNGIKACELAAVLSEKYKKTILLSEDVKDKPITGTMILEDDFKKVLDALAWMLGTEWLERENVIYIGGKVTKYATMPSAGLADQLKSNFGEGVSVIGDKMLVKGTDRDIKQVTEAASKIIDRNAVEVWLYAFEYSHSAIGNWGVTIKPQLAGTDITYDVLSSGKFNPAMLFDQSQFNPEWKTEFTDVNTKIVIDTSLTLLSGRGTRLLVGTQTEQPVYATVPNASTQTIQAQSFVTNYLQYNVGLSVEIMPYEAETDWYIETTIENSTEKSQYVKNLTNLKTFSKIGKSEGKDFVCIAQLDEHIKRLQSNGFLNSMPWLRWFLPEEKEDTIHSIVFLLAVNRGRAKDKADFFLLNPPKQIFPGEGAAAAGMLPDKPEWPKIRIPTYNDKGEVQRIDIGG